MTIKLLKTTLAIVFLMKSAHAIQGGTYIDVTLGGYDLAKSIANAKVDKFNFVFASVTEDEKGNLVWGIPETNSKEAIFDQDSGNIGAVKSLIAQGKCDTNSYIMLAPGKKFPGISSKDGDEVAQLYEKISNTFGNLPLSFNLGASQDALYEDKILSGIKKFIEKTGRKVSFFFTAYGNGFSDENGNSERILGALKNIAEKVGKEVVINIDLKDKPGSPGTPARGKDAVDYCLKAFDLAKKQAQAMGFKNFDITVMNGKNHGGMDLSLDDFKKIREALAAEIHNFYYWSFNRDHTGGTPEDKEASPNHSSGYNQKDYDFYRIFK